MRLPFSEAEFLDVFGAYNVALWPAAAALWVASIIGLALVLRGRQADRWVSALLAAHWAWSGIAYHIVFFARINPAARLFGGLFVLQSLLLAWVALAHSPVRYSWARTARHLIGLSLAIYALSYPLLALTLVEPYPRTPIFGVPCPTTLFTAGLLLMATPGRWWLMVIPLLWSVVGASAAVLLGVATDFALFGAAVSLLLYIPRTPRADR